MNALLISEELEKMPRFTTLQRRGRLLYVQIPTPGHEDPVTETFKSVLLDTFSGTLQDFYIIPSSRNGSMATFA